MSNKEEIVPTRIGSISTKSLGYTAKEIRKMVEDKPDMVFLARLGGVAMEAFGGTSKHGEWTGFKGIFTAITKDNVAYQSAAIYLASNITKKVMEMINAGVVEVEFVTDLFVTATDKNASGYAYICEPVASPEAVKKAETIAQRVFSGMLPNQGLLAAPAKKAKTA